MLPIGLYSFICISTAHLILNEHYIDVVYSGMGPPPMLNYETRAISQGGVETYNLAPHRATDIADRTRKLKEWLIRFVALFVLLSILYNYVYYFA